MSRFRFGLLKVEVERDASESSGRDIYWVRIKAPHGDLYSESKISLRKQPRSTGTDFELAAYMLEELKEASRDPKGWLAKAQAESAMSPEEILETLLFAEDMEPYIQEATAEAHQRASMYHGEHRGLVLGISRHLELPSRIRTKEDIANFFAYLYIVDRTAFHPDDGFMEYVDRDGKRAYSLRDAAIRDKLMDEARKAAKKEGLDIYEMALLVGAVSGVNDDPESEAAAPKWLKTLSKTWV